MDIPFVLQNIRPGAEWTLRGEDYSGLEWKDENQSKPTEDEVLSGWSKFRYKRLREAEYPSLADQLDALWKGGTDFELMRQRILAIKSVYPKIP